MYCIFLVATCNCNATKHGARLNHITNTFIFQWLHTNGITTSVFTVVLFSNIQTWFFFRFVLFICDRKAYKMQYFRGNGNVNACSWKFRIPTQFMLIHVLPMTLNWTVFPSFFCFLHRFSMHRLASYFYYRILLWRSPPVDCYLASVYCNLSFSTARSKHLNYFSVECIMYMLLFVLSACFAPIFSWCQE